MKKKLSTKAVPELRYIEKGSRLLDHSLRIPGTQVRFGLDPILGLFPGIGDLVAYILSAGLVVVMARNGASGKVIVLMLLNILIDAVVGSIPVLGNIFDVWFKANKRNYNLLKSHYDAGKYQGSGRGVVLFVIVALIFIFFLAIWLMLMLFKYFYALLEQILSNI